MKTAVVGGGIGGLVSALYLSNEGHHVTVFEKEADVGGRLAFIERDGFRIDKGPTIVLLPDMIRSILREAGMNPDVIEMQRLDPLYPLHFPDGTTFTKWSDTEKQLEEIRSVFPGEESSFLSYMEDMNERFEKGKQAFMDRDFRRPGSFFTKSNVRTLVKLKAYQSVKNQAKQYFSAPHLREAFSFQTLYIGGSPHDTPAIYSLVPFSEHCHGIWYVKGGYARLAQEIVKELLTRGGTIRTESEVTRIETEGGKGTGLTVNGTYEAFDTFVINGDYPVARRLTGGKGRRQSRSFTPSSGCLLLYLGINGKVDTPYVHQFFMGEDLDGHMSDVFVNKRLHVDPSFYVFSPSLIDNSAAPEGKSALYVLVPVPAGDTVTEEEYAEYAEMILDRMEERLDGKLRQKILWKDIRTPHEASQEGLFQGGSFGIAPSLFQSGVFRPQLQPFGLDNVYAVGASIHPGGGVPIVMQGAKLLAEAIREKEGRREPEPAEAFIR
ncbi:phytoene desaturase family protein [Alteribacter natronophilus]|uniref:phytoene desaturase family protein n=1 Tax=Alteribacter natronophilus TaxID=2583810 RepID=UPI00110D70FA|nr:phytoene desaturase family protein [Alteribacter natronophilus]TMW73699.1 phytoene desaturase [Alteribacter natronophilus]